MAVVLSLLMIGGGQFYNKQEGKGLLLLCGAILSAVPTLGAGVLAALILGLGDAYAIADKMRRGETVGPWQWF